jgi:hypothetical protein
MKARIETRQLDKKSYTSIFALMLNWNEFDFTVPCIDSLKKSKLPLEKIVVLDQASEDGSYEKLRSLYEGDDQVHVVRNERNYGFALGMNKGVQKSIEMGAKMVFLVNNDTVVDEDCLQHLYDVVVTKPLAAAVGPAIMYYSNPNKIWQAGGYFNRLRMGVAVPYKGKMYSDIAKDVISVEFLTGCALLIPVTTFEKVGFLDPAYFFYGEDADYGLRIKEAKLNMYFVPTAKVWHKVEDIAVDRTTPYVLYHLAKSTAILMRKRFSIFRGWYGIFLQFTVYTLFRTWQILKARRGVDSIIAWLRGLVDGIFVKV